MFLSLLLAYNYNQPEMPQCTIDRCEAEYCVVETPEGNVDVSRKPYYTEGMSIKCPFWLIEPT
jgi:hypothetical protein